MKENKILNGTRNFFDTLLRPWPPGNDKILDRRYPRAIEIARSEVDFYLDQAEEPITRLIDRCEMGNFATRINPDLFQIAIEISEPVSPLSPYKGVSVTDEQRLVATQLVKHFQYISKPAIGLGGKHNEIGIVMKIGHRVGGPTEQLIVSPDHKLLVESGMTETRRPTQIEIFSQVPEIFDLLRNFRSVISAIDKQGVLASVAKTQSTE